MSENNIINRIGITDINGIKCIIGLVENDNEYSIKYSLENKDDKYKKDVFEIINRVKNKKSKKNDKDTFWQKLKEEFVKNKYKIEDIPNSDIRIKLSIDTKTGYQLSTKEVKKLIEQADSDTSLFE